MLKVLAILMSLVISSQVSFVQSKDLTEEMLLERNGKIIVEVIEGVCLDEEGNGKIIDAGENDYISYAGIEDVNPGDEVTTYCIYNPNTSYTDDVIERVDIVKPEK